MLFLHRRVAMAHALPLLLVLLSSFHGVQSSFLTRSVPVDFLKGDPLIVKVNKLTSTKTQLPYSYYSLPYCRPENLGQVLEGDRIENSPYVFKMRDAHKCNILCRITLDANTTNEFKEKIEDEYRVLGKPGLGWIYEDSTTFDYLGFRVGFKYAGSNDDMYFINNHLSFTVKYHRDEQRIVGFEVEPFSVQHAYEGEWNGQNTQLNSCAIETILSYGSPQRVLEEKEIIFTYDVEFQEDVYLLMGDDQIHYFSVICSLMVVLFLSGTVAMIILRTLYRRYDEQEEEIGWKLLHGDIFRTPTNSDLLRVDLGTGVQLLGVILMTLTSSVLGFLYPRNGGGFMLFLFVLVALSAVYASARLHKMLRGTGWKSIALRTGFTFPGIVSYTYLPLGYNSSGAIPFKTPTALFLMSVPFVFVGSYVGFKQKILEHPVKTNNIPRQIPKQAWYMNPIFSILVGGILPFALVFIEFSFILTSIRHNQFYSVSGLVLLVFIIHIVTCAEITIVLCYLQFCRGDYLWWWRSFLTSGSSALYLFLYATFYFFTKIDTTKLVYGELYIGYMLIASYAVFVATGTVGFYSCFWFTRLIYSSLKID